MTVTFRQATRDDVPAVLALLRDDGMGKTREVVGLETYLAAFDRMASEPDNIVIVGEMGGEIIATCQLTCISGLSVRAARRAQVEGVRVASQMRGQGIGRLLLDDAQDRARAAGCTLFQLTMNKGRTSSARFYESLGFTPSHIGYKRDLL